MTESLTPRRGLSLGLEAELAGHLAELASEMHAAYVQVAGRGCQGTQRCGSREASSGWTGSAGPLSPS
jgi:hypothetical protein